MGGLTCSADELVEHIGARLLEKIRHYLALSQKSGRVVSGVSCVLRALKTRKIALVLTASDLAENSRDRLEVGCRAAGIACRALPLNRVEVGRALGRSPRAVVALPDGPLVRAIVQTLENFGSISSLFRAK